jgi:hypothetical protein
MPNQHHNPARSLDETLRLCLGRPHPPGSAPGGTRSSASWCLSVRRRSAGKRGGLVRCPRRTETARACHRTRARHRRRRGGGFPTSPAHAPRWRFLVVSLVVPPKTMGHWVRNSRPAGTGGSQFMTSRCDWKASLCWPRRQMTRTISFPCFVAVLCGAQYRSEIDEFGGRQIRAGHQ